MRKAVKTVKTVKKIREYKCFNCKSIITEFQTFKTHKYCSPCYDEKLILNERYLEFDELYQYVRGTVMGYTKDMALTSSMAMKLKGLTTSQSYYKNSEKEYSNYTFKDILLTYKAKSIEITIASNSISFRNEMHKFNYMLKIVSSSINDIILRLQKKQLLKEKTDDLQIDEVIGTSTYKSKHKDSKVQSICKDLW